MSYEHASVSQIMGHFISTLHDALRDGDDIPAAEIAEMFADIHVDEFSVAESPAAICITAGDRRLRLRMENLGQTMRIYTDHDGNIWDSEVDDDAYDALAYDEAGQLEYSLYLMGSREEIIAGARRDLAERENKYDCDVMNARLKRARASAKSTLAYLGE